MKAQIFAYLLVVALVPLSISTAVFALNGENQASASQSEQISTHPELFSDKLPIGFQGTSTPIKTTGVVFERPIPLGTEIQDPWPDSGTGWD